MTRVSAVPAAIPMDDNGASMAAITAGERRGERESDSQSRDDER
jgi:hypothetical protein